MKGFRYTILGGGRQGSAIAYDLARLGKARTILIADIDLPVAKEAAKRTNHLTKSNVASAIQCDFSQPTALPQSLWECDVCVSALPYFFNLVAAEKSISEGVHFCDLGGNTEIVLKELDLDAKARASKVSLLPDCGLAPGLANLLAARSIEKLGNATNIHARCGGLPQNPKPPLHYKAVFSLDGLINEYSGEAIVVRNGKIKKLPALSEREEIDIPDFGRLEAFVTTGGSSTAPYSFQNKVKNFDYKTLRYVGHHVAIKAYADLGLFRNEPITFLGKTIVPRKFFMEMLYPLIDFPEDKDVVILTVEAENDKGKKYLATLIDRGAPDGSFSAMERTTGFPTSVTAYMQALGKIAPGAHPVEKAVPLTFFLDQLGKRGLIIKETLS